MTRKKIGFIIHPRNVTDVKYLFPPARLLSRQGLKAFIRMLPPYRFISLNGIKSKTGFEIDGFGIVCPLLPEQMVGSEEPFAIRKITECIKLAKRLGAEIVGLGGFTSIIGSGGEIVARDAGVAVTSGNTYTASLVIEGVASY